MCAVSVSRVRNGSRLVRRQSEPSRATSTRSGLEKVTDVASAALAEMPSAEKSSLSLIEPSPGSE